MSFHHKKLYTSEEFINVYTKKIFLLFLLLFTRMHVSAGSKLHVQVKQAPPEVLLLLGGANRWHTLFFFLSFLLALSFYFSLIFFMFCFLLFLKMYYKVDAHTHTPSHTFTHTTCTEDWIRVAKFLD